MTPSKDPPSSASLPAGDPAGTGPGAAQAAQGAAPLAVRSLGGVGEMTAEAWDALANPPGRPFNPFVAHAFLKALEDSGSATQETGWAPMHLVMEEPDGTPRGLFPLYLKSHSYGEYVFDHGWGHAYERAGGHYYPKLQSSVPFTPATAPKLLVRPGPAEAADRLRLAGAAVQVARKLGVSSLHATFLPPADRDAMAEAGYLQRTDQQFHWMNRGYATFDDFLGELSSAKRKTLRKERARALENGVEIEWVTGEALSEAHWDAFYRFYMDTGARKWGQPYLTRAFFSLIGETFADRTLLIMARREGRYIAGALNFVGGDTLYGRNWGCVERHKFLHFEACYYQAIDFAIDRGLARVEAGAQGQHKLARGYEPALTRSAHWIADPGFRDAVARFLEEERAHVEEDREILSAHTPFRKTDGRGGD